MHKGTVLSVDDDEGLQTVVGHYLEGDGYTVLKAVTAAEAVEKIDLPHDVVLLDLVLPDGEGLTLIPQVRAKSKAAIIVVSGKNDTTEKIICLEMGADDYITKPFEMRELSARIKAIIRRIDDVSSSSQDSEEAGEKLTFDNGYILDRTQYQLLDNKNNSADLTTGEFQLLEAMALSANRALSREQLFELTGRDGDFDVYDRAIDIQIARLRKKLGDDDGEIIKTVRGVGYMFCGIAQ